MRHFFQRTAVALRLGFAVFLAQPYQQGVILIIKPVLPWAGPIQTASGHLHTPPPARAAVSSSPSGIGIHHKHRLTKGIQAIESAVSGPMPLMDSNSSRNRSVESRQPLQIAVEFFKQPV